MLKKNSINKKKRKNRIKLSKEATIKQFTSKC